MNKRVLLSTVMALLLMAALIPTVLAAPNSDTIIEAGEVVNNDVSVFDGDLVIYEGAEVNGNIFVFNGNATIDGQVNGSVTLFNGDAVISGVVNVDLTLFNGNLQGEDSAYIGGECVVLNGTVWNNSENDSLDSCTTIQGSKLNALAGLAPNMFKNSGDIPLPAVPAVPEVPAAPAVPAVPELPSATWDQDMHGIVEPHSRFRNEGPQAFGVFSSSVLFGFLGLLVGFIAPNNLRQIAGTARNKPVVSGMAGALTAVAVPSLILLLIPISIILTFVCIGLLGFPIMFLLGLGLAVGAILGWIAVGTWLGLRLFGRGKDDRIVLAAAMGTGLLTFLVGLFGMVTAFGGGLLTFFIFCIGLGAVALTQFGMKSFPRSRQADSSDGGTPSNALDPDKLNNVLDTLPPKEITL